jgi:hypothetical protein
MLTADFGKLSRSDPLGSLAGGPFGSVHVRSPGMLVERTFQAVPGMRANMPASVGLSLSLAHATQTPGEPPFRVFQDHANVPGSCDSASRIVRSCLLDYATAWLLNGLPHRAGGGFPLPCRTAYLRCRSTCRRRSVRNRERRLRRSPRCRARRRAAADCPADDRQQMHDACGVHLRSLLVSSCLRNPNNVSRLCLCPLDTHGRGLTLSRC